jgi:hypothetical protein
MVSVGYSLVFNYRSYRGELFPVTTVELSASADDALAVEQDAFLDSGASRSIFRGEIPAMLGLNLLDGEPWEFETNTGVRLEARVHDVRVALMPAEEDAAPVSFIVPLAFATGEIGRNLLGRDFFRLTQIGFRERHSQFYLEPTP